MICFCPPVNPLYVQEKRCVCVFVCVRARMCVWCGVVWGRRAEESEVLPVCLRVWNVTDVTVTTLFVCFKGRRKEVEWADLELFGFQIRHTKKDLADSYKKEQAEKNPHGVQRALCLIRQKQFL